MIQQKLEGTFIREEKTRFLCAVEIDGNPEQCYVPSSCKLEQLINLQGETVWLKPVHNRNSNLKYCIYAVKKKQGWVLLNLAEANNIIEAQLNRRLFSFLGNRKEVQREKLVEGYKADLYLPASRTVIEIKTVLTEEESAIFPGVKSLRIERQLIDIGKLLEAGYKVCYFVIALNPRTARLEIAEKLKDIFRDGISKGMLLKGYSLKFEEELPKIYKSIEVKL